MSGEGLRQLRRALRGVLQAGLAKRRELHRRSNLVSKCAAVGDRRFAGLGERSTLSIERPLEGCATRGLVGGRETGQTRNQRSRHKLWDSSHWEVTVAAGVLSASGFAPCRRLTAAWSCVSLSFSGGT